MLALGVGPYVGTAGPGQVGNFALAGHRTTFPSLGCRCRADRCRPHRGRRVTRRSLLTQRLARDLVGVGKPRAEWDPARLAEGQG